MATTNYTSLLGLALPTQGDLSGQWGTEVNNYITTYLDSAIAGQLAISLTGNLTLTKATGTSLSSTSSQYAILNVTPSASTWTITVPAASQIYHINNLSSTHTFTIKASGQTGFVVAATEKCVVAYNGTDFVRVGSTSVFGAPSASMTLSGTSTNATLKLSNTTSGSGALDGFDLIMDGTDAYVYNRENAPILFGTNNAERMRLDSSGNLLLGATSDPTFGGKMYVQGTQGPTFVATGASTVQVLACWQQATTGDNSLVKFYTETSPTLRGSISYNRGAGLVSYNTTSDYRAKDIFGPVVDSGTLIDSTPVYMGKMKGATQERPMFIAHETPAYAHTGEKDAVDKDGNPVYQQMDASTLIPVMWAEIQSLRIRIAQLEAK